VSARAVVVDDHLVLRLLLGDEPAVLRPHGGTVATTGLWYHRLCRALVDHAVIGAMSRSLGNVEAGLASRAVQAVIELPETIELISLRNLGWSMAELLSIGVRLNLLSLEALAAAEHLGADLCLASADENPPLCEAAALRGVRVRII
jgi:hypothetical protein